VLQDLDERTEMLEIERRDKRDIVGNGEVLGF